MKNRTDSIVAGSLLTAGSLVCLWSAASVAVAVKQSGGFINLISSYFHAMAPQATMVDSYTSLKGIEYLIVVAFLVVLIPFIQYLNKGEEGERVAMC